MNNLRTIKNLLDMEWKYQTSSDTAAVTDFWEALTDAQKRRVEQAIQQMGSGQGMPHEKKYFISLDISYKVPIFLRISTWQEINSITSLKML